MKRLLIILISIPLIFNSCKKEDNGPNSGTNDTSGSILGTWRVQSGTDYIVSGYIDPVYGTEEEIESYTSSWTNPFDTIKRYWVFRYDSTFSQYYYYFDTLNHYLDFTYIKNGDEVDMDGGFSFTITILTNNNLNIKQENISQTLSYDTTFFQKTISNSQWIKSQLPSITTQPLNKKKPVNGYNSFLNRRK